MQSSLVDMVVCGGATPVVNASLSSSSLMPLNLHIRLKSAIEAGSTARSQQLRHHFQGINSSHGAKEKDEDREDRRFGLDSGTKMKTLHFRLGKEEGRGWDRD
ncbi:unnamed protein product [Linum trigynum]|uniref:Uncharacterized protein n=1 Tax=Linum trigynum TaxID=586398 RepID=A0AAV2DFN2_9ROSI